MDGNYSLRGELPDRLRQYCHCAVSAAAKSEFGLNPVAEKGALQAARMIFDARRRGVGLCFPECAPPFARVAPRSCQVSAIST